MSKPGGKRKRKREAYLVGHRVMPLPQPSVLRGQFLSGRLQLGDVVLQLLGVVPRDLDLALTLILGPRPGVLDDTLEGQGRLQHHVALARDHLLGNAVVEMGNLGIKR